MIAPRLGGPWADGDRDPGRAQPGVALPRHLGVRVRDRRDDPGDAGLDDGVGAGRRFAEVRAGLKGHVERRPARRLTRALDCDPLGMRPPARRRRAAPARPRRP